MQLAFYRLHHRICATYETASTRQFLHGRTETLRVLCVEGKEFVQAMEDATPMAKLEKLKAFLQAHKSYLIDASNGHGVDRHLLGLRSMVGEGEAQPGIFQDPIYWKSLSFDLSTSNVSPGESYEGLGFGPATSTGYGINYSIAPTNIRFSVTSWAPLDPRRMRDAVIGAMEDLAKLFAQQVPSKI
jgi:carnitine O-acetyltransferase